MQGYDYPLQIIFNLQHSVGMINNTSISFITLFNKHPITQLPNKGKNNIIKIGVIKCLIKTCSVNSFEKHMSEEKRV